MFGSKVENSINYSKKTYSKRQISRKLAGWTPSFENFHLVHLLCPDCCISFFSSSFLPEYLDPCQENLMKHSPQKKVSELNDKYCTNNDKNNDDKNLSY